MKQGFVQSISTIEIPVSRIRDSVEWYQKYVNAGVMHESESDAMLHLLDVNATGAPALYLVATASGDKLSFRNSGNGVIHGIIDFFVSDLEGFHSFLAENGVQVTDIHYFNATGGLGGFGFRDPDGNLFGATNVNQRSNP